LKIRVKGQQILQSQHFSPNEETTLQQRGDDFSTGKMVCVEMESSVSSVSRPVTSAPSQRSPRTLKSSQTVSLPPSPSSNPISTILSSQPKSRKEKVQMMKPRQLNHLPISVYKEQCRQARLQFEVAKQKKALQVKPAFLFAVDLIWVRHYLKLKN
jgi:hypothetical protein